MHQLFPSFSLTLVVQYDRNSGLSAWLDTSSTATYCSMDVRASRQIRTGLGSSPRATACLIQILFRVSCCCPEIMAVAPASIC